EDAIPHVSLQRVEVVDEREALSLAELRGHVGHVDARRGRGAQGGGDLPDEEARQQAREEAAGPGHDEGGGGGGLQGVARGTGVERRHPDAPDATRAGDARLRDAWRTVIE